MTVDADALYNKLLVGEITVTGDEARAIRRLLATVKASHDLTVAAPENTPYRAGYWDSVQDTFTREFTAGGIA